ncbi:trypsin-like serine protease [Enterovibrio norvegicus]|uniref:trypsin-like serine protease n=1 Tax=Enterovibrio norvegicus TaxID=188144 RepID=UPI0035588B80
MNKKLATLFIGAAFAPSLLLAQPLETKDVSPRIVGGKPAAPENWAFYTQIVNRPSNRSFCGASYIGDGYVLTAAHCVDNDAPNHIAVKIGGIRYNGTDGVRVNVEQIFIHPDFNTRTLANDIALLKLTNVPSGVQPVDIAAGSVSQYAVEGDTLTVAGLGRTSEGGSSPTVLQEVDVPLVSDAVCRQSGGNYANVGSVSFCAGIPAGGIDSCQGDSGGPLVINQAGQITQLGIVSWGIGCARPGKYGVYSDIAALRRFVDGIVGNSNDVPSVEYKANETLTAFNWGDIKQHTFAINNTGSVGFTVENVNVTGSGVATSPVIANDQCTMATLSAGESCQIEVEFGASMAGTATANLTFDIDKTTTVYRAKVSAIAKDPSTPPTGACQDEWKPGTIYLTGDTVNWANTTWQAKWWTQGDDPSQSNEWGVWKAIGSVDCSPTTPPVNPPTEPEPPTEPPANGNAYEVGQNYNAGDIVTNNGESFECLSWPNGLWCSGTPSVYAPGTGTSWQLAWVKR